LEQFLHFGTSDPVIIKKWVLKQQIIKNGSQLKF